MTEKAYQIGASWDNDVLLIVIMGQASKQDAEEIAQNVHEIFDAHQPRKVLIDCTQVAGRLGITDTYFHVRKYKVSNHRPDKIAVPDNAENASYYSFFETTAANIGLRPKFFSDIDEAMRWLQQ